ncbi:MAG TPA: efflux RND transporter permease subunit [Puia sp.]|uniref:efflux RND transporter permease subunit n=1 Tax=Puia sp. TaxID=2045100 RepID=UPI002CA66A06|nr:efflux RND transporter permease subunit [Puia sp.]HVU98053.1 efflux RND transporter permease subunit [Puia sp.]
MKQGLSGKIAQAFISSKLTILLMIAFLVIGGFSTVLIPKEEEPQIDVPVADIFVGFPGAEPKEVETKLTAPLEKIVSNVKGVEHVYSTSMQGRAMLIVQFYVGQDVERSMVKLYDELLKNMDKMPLGVTMPLIKARAIDDVPVLGLTLWSDKHSDYELKQLGEALTTEIKKINDVASINIIGGRSREVKVVLDKTKMAENHLDFLAVANHLQANNSQLLSGTLLKNDTAFSVETGNFLTTAEDVANVIVGTNGGQPVYLRQLGKVSEGLETPDQYVQFGYGKADPALQKKFGATYPAITITIAKKKGADAMQLSDEILAKIDHLKKHLLPSDLQVTVTRNYGETASEKVSGLLFHLFISIVAVTLFVMLAMGWRGGLVVFLSVPVTFALTLFAYYLMHYTLNRITLFALVFITGIVVDDSIIIAENMHRHFMARRLSFKDAAIFAINEVGNPTILATFTVIAAVLPMAFVTGLMGPYMGPMPVGASIAMLCSLLVALTLTPYLGCIFLRKKGMHEVAKPVEQTRTFRLYRSLIGPLLEKRWKRWVFMLGTVVALLASMAMFYTKAVVMKMLPFDNKNEFQVVVDMPEGTTLEKTLAAAKEIAAYVSDEPMVRNYQVYAGTAAPISFNGLIRHYDIRRGDNVADVQVNLTDKKDRREQSHAIVKRMRDAVQSIARKYNANAKLVELPPGPPVLSTLVAEVYGPDYTGQLDVAQKVKRLFHATKDVVDIDWYVEDDQSEYHFEINKDKAMRYGVSPGQIVANLNAAMSGEVAGTLHQPASFSQENIKLQLSDAAKSNLEELRSLKVVGQQGNTISVGDLVTVTRRVKEKSIYRKDQKRVVYVTADMAGQSESPIYAITQISDSIKKMQLPAGYTISEEYTHQPGNEDNYTVKWDGEWQITFDAFRDLGIAFGVAVFFIYLLIVGWFQNFVTPLIMLAAIPLSLIGIVFGHWILGAYFTAPSLVGFIALAGVMVRNSILLVDFLNMRLEEGLSLKEAIVEAGAVRTTPILLTAGAVVLGSVIILFDPIFQGLAISLMGGTITSTFLTLLVVPLLCFRLLTRSNKLKLRQVE